MARRANERARKALQAEASRLLVERLRICVWIGLFSVGMYVLAGESFIRPVTDPAYVLYVLEILLYVTALLLLRGARAEERAVPLAVLVMGSTCVLTAALGVATDDVSTGPLVYIIITMATATLFPWGVRPQLVLVAVAAASATWNTLVGWHVFSPLVAYALLAMMVALVTSVYVAYEFDRYRTRHWMAEEQLRWSATQLEEAQEVAQLGSFDWDLETGEMSWSDQLYRILGVEPSDGLPPNFEAGVERIHPDDRDRLIEKVSQVIAEQSSFDLTFRVLRPDGTSRVVSARGRAIVDEGRDLTVRLIGTCQDITDRIQLEEQLRQSQKMEAVGRLAGGIAHDFNNLLTIIRGSVSLIGLELNSDAEAQEDLRAIDSATTRASDLTQQLLAFARRQGTSAKELDLNLVLRNLNDLLQRLIGEEIRLEVQSGPSLAQVHIDPGQLEQVIVNLVVNARDAMPDGGTLVLETENVSIGDDVSNLEAGRYVRLVVRDTGVGMTEDVRTRIFEPFFTTKEPGKGTGLGLATSYGIVSHHGGDIVVESQPGKGSAFHVFLPSGGPARAQAEVSASRSAAALDEGRERVLVIEDESLVRRLAVRVLERRGYDVVEAASGEEALRMVEANGHSPIELVVADVVMPGLRGPDVAQRLRRFYPGLRVLLMSGYTDVDVDVEHSGVPFLTKPFTPDGLAEKVREVLDAGGTKAEAEA